jgi:high-affinity iron transporter
MRLILNGLTLTLILTAPVEAAQPDGFNTGSVFLNSFGILVREGLEALLICTALAAAASRAGSRDGVRAIWQGATAAIVVSIATAVAVDRVLHLTEADQEAIEGVTMLLASAVLFYVSYWLLSKLEVARWMGYLRDRMVDAESRWAMGGVAFLAVYREGAETVLFYRALASIGAGFPMWAGIAAGAVVMVAIGTAVLRYGARLPIRPLFAVTGLLLYYLALVFAGRGVHELQEAGWISETAWAIGPRIGPLGIYPTVETMVAQSLLLGLAIIAGVVILVGWKRARRVLEATAAVAQESTGK